MHRLALCLVLLVACGRSRGPAWPERSEPETDGGESLEPRSPSIVAASEKPDAPTTPAAETKPAEEAPAAKPDAAATPAAPAAGEPIMVDDIVIEIEDE